MSLHHSPFGTGEVLSSSVGFTIIVWHLERELQRETLIISTRTRSLEEDPIGIIGNVQLRVKASSAYCVDR
jgi:hypothetical protein